MTPQCSLDGCERSVYCKQLCSMHYLRVRRTGAPGSAERQKAEWGAGYVDADGYRVVHAPGHPLARAQGKVPEHRVVLFDAIGDGPHPCVWCAVSLNWTGTASDRICVDHLDFDRLNNTRTNLVVSCLDCNTKRTAA